MNDTFTEIRMPDDQLAFPSYCYTTNDIPGTSAMCLSLGIGGCNFRCPYCFNGNIVDPGALEREILIRKQQPELFMAHMNDNFKTLLGRLATPGNPLFGMINGVVITGGEPTLYHKLPELFGEFDVVMEKNPGFVHRGLFTNGTNPDMVKSLLERNLITFIGIDIKTGFQDYARVAASKESAARIKETLEQVSEYAGNWLAGHTPFYQIRIPLIWPVIRPEELKPLLTDIRRLTRACPPVAGKSIIFRDGVTIPNVNIHSPDTPDGQPGLVGINMHKGIINHSLANFKQNNRAEADELLQRMFPRY